MGIFDSFDISASGMTAMRDQMDLIATNLANVNTTHTADGGPYRRKVAIYEENKKFDSFYLPAAFGELPFDDEAHQLLGSGARLAGVVKDPAPFKKIYDPNNPEADAHGYVSMPNVDLITEMTNMIQASRAYEANAAAIDANKTMMNMALKLVYSGMK